MRYLRTFGRLVVISMMACGHAPVAGDSHKVQLAVIPAESDVFPRAAQAVNASLAAAKVSGIDQTQVSKVSLEVVQLSVECVDPTSTCYEAIGRSMSVNQLLFARITGSAKKHQLKVMVTLFDVDAKAAKRTAEKVFGSEDAVAAGAAALVAEVAR